MTNLAVNSRHILAKGGITDVTDFLLMTPHDISRKCRISLFEAQKAFSDVCNQLCRPLHYLGHIVPGHESTLTTGDPELDCAVGGGIRTGMIWEVVGESASGKSQLALQLSLLVQLPTALGGILGSSCYLTSSSRLSTERLDQLLHAHPLLSPSLCDLKNVHTISTPSPELLFHVLSTILPQFISDTARNLSLKPVKLVVLDALPDIFRSAPATTTALLVDRSRYITEFSTLLQRLASKHNIAVLVLNNVVDVFDNGPFDSSRTREIFYHDQFRWFARSEVKSGADGKEASLGLIWANQINARLFMERTRRRCYINDSVEPPDQSTKDDLIMLVRKLSVVFSSVSLPASLDYIVTSTGISCVNTLDAMVG